MVLLGTLTFAQGNDDPAAWVSTGRYHHQFLPDVVEYEPQGLSETDIAGLQKLGHTLKQVDRRYGNMQAIAWNTRTRRHAGSQRPASPGQRAGALRTGAESEP